MPLEVIDGGRKQRQFVCPWCGDSFTFKFAQPDSATEGDSLEEHWMSSRECAANKATNNPTQTKYQVRDED